ncbi:hypothetical protein J7L68_10000 [bacterium]|nr:hypothetical protein [bacterium]
MKKIALKYRFLHLLMFISIVTASDLPKVAYSGVFTANTIQYYPIYARNSRALDGELRFIFQEANSKGNLPFEIIFETDVEARKNELSNNYSLCLLITRDDISSITFQNITKTTVNVGITAIIYELNRIENKRNIVFSVPIVGYSTDLSAKKPLNERDIDALFIATARQTLDYLLTKLVNLQIEQIEGFVVKISSEFIKINLGLLDGLEKGQFVKVYSDSGIVSAQVNEIEKKESFLKFSGKFQGIREGTIVKARNIRGLSDEIYQVVSFKNESKLASELFDKQLLSESIGQWFSDFLSSKAGKVVLPSRIGGRWQDHSAERTRAIFVMNDVEYEFEMRKPKHPIRLKLTGLATKLINESNINQNFLYKAWLEIEFIDRGLKEEYSETATSTVVKGAFEFQSEAVFFDLLHKLTNKIAKEIDL